MLSQEVRAVLIALAAVVVLGVLVALIGYPMPIVIALIATLAIFVLMVLVSADDLGRLVRPGTSSRAQPGQPGA